MSIIALLRRLIGKPTMVKITDIPAAALNNAVMTLARGFAGMPDHQARARLDTYVSRVRPAVISALDEEMGERVLARFREAVMATKAKLETARSTQRHRTGGRR